MSVAPAPSPSRFQSRRRLLSVGAKMLILSVVGGLVLAGLTGPFVGLFAVTAKRGADAFNDLPTDLLTPPLPQASRMYDAKGNVIAYLHGSEDRQVVPLATRPALSAASGHRHRGLPLLRAPRHRLQGARAGSRRQPGIGRVHPGRVDPDPAIRQERAAGVG